MDETQEETPPEEKDHGQIVVTFTESGEMSVSFRDMRPWKFWAAAEMLRTLGDQQYVQAQMQQMAMQQAEAQARQDMLQTLAMRPGGLRGPIRRD